MFEPRSRLFSNPYRIYMATVFLITMLYRFYKSKPKSYEPIDVFYSIHH